MNTLEKLFQRQSNLKIDENNVSQFCNNTTHNIHTTQPLNQNSEQFSMNSKLHQDTSYTENCKNKF